MTEESREFLRQPAKAEAHNAPQACEGGMFITHHVGVQWSTFLRLPTVGPPSLGEDGAIPASHEAKWEGKCAWSVHLTHHLTNVFDQFLFSFAS